MEERAENGNSLSSFGHHYEDVSDKTLSIQNMLRTITTEQKQTKNNEPSMSPSAANETGEDSDLSSNSDSTESSVDDSNPSNVLSDTDVVDVEDAPMETVTDTSHEIPEKPPLKKEPPRVVKKKLILNPDLKAAHRIVMQIMSDRANYAFMDEVDVVALKLWDYHDRIKEPMWLTKIEDKFEKEEYLTITEVIRDIRLMLENCYRYNGLEHYVSKQAMKIEQVLETKLSLLPRILQVQTTLYVTSDGKYGELPVTASTSLTGRRRTSGRFNDGVAITPLSNCIQSEYVNAQLEAKKRQQQERHEELLRYRQELDEWERDLLQEPKQQHLNAMWEIPAIGQFLILFQEPLALNEGSYYELERCFLLPRESKLLAQIFTCLLSSPTQRKREISKNMGMAMPYNVWQRKLKERVQKWYQVVDSWQDTQWAASDLGIDVHFFEVMGDKYPFDDYQYHELTYYQRVILMKAVCDNCLEIQPSLRQCLDVQPVLDQRAIVLGEDSSGNTYVHFPQFCGYDLRIYKQGPFPEPELRYIEVDEPDEPENMDIDNNASGESSDRKKVAVEAEKVASPEQRKRPSHLRQRLTPVISNLNRSKRKHTKTSMSSKGLFADSDQKEIAQSNNNCNNQADSKSQNNNVERISEDKSGKDNLCIHKDSNKEEESVETQKELTLQNGSDLLSSKEEASEAQLKTLPKSDMNKEENNHNNCNSVQLLGRFAEDHICNEKPTIAKSIDDHQKCNGQIQSEICESKIKLKELKTSDAESPVIKEELITEDLDMVEKEHKTEETHNKEEPKISSDELCKVDTQMKEDDTTKDIEMITMEEEATNDIKEVEEPKTPLKESNKFDINEVNNTKNFDVKEEEKAETIKVGGTDQVEEEQFKKIDAENEKSEFEEEETKTEEEPVRPKLELPVVEPDKAAFELVCDSIESLRSLVSEFAEGVPVEVTKGRKKKIIKPPPRTQSEIDLHETLTRLLVELSPHESKLTNAIGRVKERLRKEFDNFQDSQEESDSWESESSSSSGSSSSSDSDSSDSSDEEENVEEDKPKEQINQLVEEEPMDVNEPFLGISTRAQKISKKKELIAAKKRAKLRGSEDQAKAKKQCMSPGITSSSTIPTQNPATITQSRLPPSVNMENIYQTLQNQIAAACMQTKVNHSIVSTVNIPGTSQANPTSGSPACTIVVDNSIWKEMQDDPQMQKEIVLKYLLQQRQRLSGQSRQTSQATHLPQEVSHAASGNVDKTCSVTAPIPNSTSHGIAPQTSGLPSISKYSTTGQSSVLLSSPAMESQEKLKQIQYLQTMLREPQRKVESTQKEILLSKLSASSYIPTLCGTSGIPTTGVPLSKPHSSVVTPTAKLCTPSSDKVSDAQNQIHQAKKQKENMLAQQWLQQLTSLQPTTSKSPNKSQFSAANVKPVNQVSTLTNIPTTGVTTNLQTISSLQLITQAAKLLEKKPNKCNPTGYLEHMKKIQQLPNEAGRPALTPSVLAKSIPSTGVKTLADGNLVKIQSPTNTADATSKGHQEVVVSLEYLQKLQQQAKMQQSNATVINQQVKTIPQNLVNRKLIVLKSPGSHGSGNITTSTVPSGSISHNAATNSQSSNPQHTTIKVQPTAQALLQPTVKQGQLCIVKMADGTLRTLNLVNQKEPLKKNILTSSLMTNQSSPVYLNVPVSQTMVAKPQTINNSSNVRSTLVVQTPPTVTSQLSNVKTSPSLVLPSSPANTTKTTMQVNLNQSPLAQPTTLPAKIYLSSEEYKVYMHSRVLPARYNNQQTAVVGVPHGSLQQGHTEAVNTVGNGYLTSLQSNHQNTSSGYTSNNSCATIVGEMNRVIKEGTQSNVNQE